MGKQIIIPPKDGWKERTWYLVEISFFPENPVHRKLFYSGFLNDQDNSPGGYNFLAEATEYQTINNVCYLKVIREIVSEKEYNITPDPHMPPQYYEN